MLPIVMAIFLSVFAIAVLILVTMKKGGPTSVGARLAALDQEFAPTDYEEKATDIRRAQHKLSRIPWVNRWLTGMNIGANVSLFLYQAGVTATFGSLVTISFAGSAILGFLAYFRLGATLPTLILSGVFLPLPYLYVRRKRAKRLNKMEQQLPEALGMMVSALRVGHSMVASLGAVAQESDEPIGGEFRKCFEEQNYGVDMRTAMMNLTDRAPIQDLRIFVAAVLIQKESGGNLAEVLEKVAQTTRERFRLKKQVSVHTAQGRMTGWILTFLPAVLGLAMYFMNPEGMSTLWTDPLGIKLLYTSVIMDIIGGLIIRKIVAIKV